MRERQSDLDPSLLCRLHLCLQTKWKEERAQPVIKKTVAMEGLVIQELDRFVVY